MRKLAVSLVLLLACIVVNAQEVKVITTVSESGDVASFELDCSKNFPILAPGLHYNIIRNEFKGADMINDYRILLVMSSVYSKTLIDKITVSAVFSDGTTISEIKTMEESGFFNGTCTLKLKSPPEQGMKLDLKQVIIHADKDVIYTISEKKSREFKKNLIKIVNTK